MSRLAPFLAVLAAMLGGTALAASPASAQITYTFQTYGDRDTPSSGATNYLVNWPISLAECEANEPISMVLTGAPYDATGMTRLVWDLWQGGTGSTGADCQTATNRRTSTGATAVCTHRPDWDGGQITTTMPTLELRPQELFPDGCTTSTQGTYVFYVLAVSATNDTTTDVAATGYFSFSIALDFVAPTAPMVEDAAGDRQIVLEWTNETTETLSSARVYVDTSAPCGESTVLVAGEAPPSTISPVATVTGSAPTTANLDGADLGLAVGETASVAVTVLDLARNESVLSNVACIERVPVEGFWDAYCAERGLTTAECSARYSSCAALPGRGSRSALGALALLGVALLVSRRRASRPATSPRSGGAR